MQSNTTESRSSFLRFTIGILSLILSALYFLLDVSTIEILAGRTHVTVYPGVFFLGIGILLVGSSRRR